MLLSEGWTDPATWMQFLDRFGVAVTVIVVGALFMAAIGYVLFLIGRRIYNDYSPMIKKKAEQVADAHTTFLKTAGDSIDVHAKANAAHAAAHAVSAESLRAISEAVEEGIDAHRDRLSDLVRIVRGGLAAVGDGLEELETMHKDNPPMLRAIAKFRVRLASMQAVHSRNKPSDT